MRSTVQSVQHLKKGDVIALMGGYRVNIGEVTSVVEDGKSVMVSYTITDPLGNSVSAHETFVRHQQLTLVLP